MRGRIAVTGGAGFLGSHVVDELRRRGADEIIVPRSRDVDLRDPHATDRWLADTRPEVIFHLAARVGGIGANRRYPGTYFHDNMIMGVNVLEAARKRAIRKVIVAGTICSYPKHAPVPFREDTLWDGYPEETNAPYGVAKKALLVMAQSYRQEFGSNFIVLFPVNLYGPRDNFDLEDSHVIPGMIRRLSTAVETGQRTVTLWGDGSPTREFLYVDDCADGLITAAERYDGADPVNLGTGVEISIKDLATKIAGVVGFDGELIWDTSKPNGQPRRRLDVRRACERFGWRAETSFDDGLRRTIAWYQEQPRP